MMGLSGLGLDLLLCFLDLQMPNLGKYAMKWSCLGKLSPSSSDCLAHFWAAQPRLFVWIDVF